MPRKTIRAGMYMRKYLKFVSKEIEAQSHSQKKHTQVEAICPAPKVTAASILSNVLQVN